MPYYIVIPLLGQMLGLFLLAQSGDIRVRIWCVGILIMSMLSLLLTFSREKRERENLLSEIKKLKNTYDALDEQAKIIVRTDLELSKAHEELDKRINGLFTLHDFSRVITATLHIDKIFDAFSDTLLLKLGFEKGLVLLKENENKMLFKKSVGYNKEDMERIASATQGILKDEFQSYLATLNDVATFDALSEADPRHKKLCQMLNVNSLVFSPLLSGNEAIGFIIVGNETPGDLPTDTDKEIVSILANQIVVAIENARLYEDAWRSRQELETKIKLRTKELETANENLIKVNKAKSDFVSAVAHELRTPLAAIKGYASIILSGNLGALAEQQTERLIRINRHSDNLGRLINDLLDISRIESGKVEMHIQRVAVKEFLKDIEDMVQPQIESRKLKFCLDISSAIEYIQADRTMMERVLINLVGNALKFTPAGGNITIKADKDDSSIKIAVIDTGIGIAPQDTDKLFDEFYRVDNEINAKEKGSGLGLSLVKRIIEAHEGRIWIESQQGKGSKFIFTLPQKTEDG